MEVLETQWTSERGAQAGWVLAGLPIGVAFLQAVASLTGYKVGNWPVIGPMASAIHSFEILSRASLIFFQETALVVFLFLLIAISWITVGITVFPNRFSLGGQRDTIRTGAVAFSAVLYIVLFFGVYLPLLGSDVGVLQQAAFFGIPFITSGVLVGTLSLYPVEGAVKDLERARQTLQKKRETFDSLVEDDIDRNVLDDFEQTLPEGDGTVAQARSELEEFEDEADELADDITSEEQKAAISKDRALLLKQRAKRLDPEGVVDDVAELLSNRVVDRVNAEYNPLTVRTPYNSEYELVNHRSTVTVRRVDGLGEAGNSRIHLSEIAKTIRNGVRNDSLDAKNAMLALLEIDEAVYGANGVVESLRDKEESFVDVVDEVESEIDGIKEDIDDLFESQVSNVLSRIYIDGAVNNVRTVDDVRNHVADGKELLAECRFDEAMRQAETASTIAREIHSALDDLWALTGRLADGREVVGIPPRNEYKHAVLPAEVFEKLRPALKSAYGAEYELEEGHNQLEVSYRDTMSEPEISFSSNPGEVISAAEGILGEIRTVAASDDAASDREVEVQYDGGQIPEFFKSEAALDCLRRFFDERSGLVAKANILEDDTRYITIRAPEETDIEQCMTEVIDEFESWAEISIQTDRNTR